MTNRKRMQQNEVRTFAKDLVEDVRIATADLHIRCPIFAFVRQMWVQA
jgi:hypothetical protein